MARTQWFARVQHRSGKRADRPQQFADGCRRPTQDGSQAENASSILVARSATTNDVELFFIGRSGAYSFGMAKTWTSTGGDIVADTDVRKVDEAKLRELLSDLAPRTEDDLPFKFAEHHPVPLGE